MSQKKAEGTISSDCWVEQAKLYSDNSFQPLSLKGELGGGGGVSTDLISLFWHQFDFIAWSERGNSLEVCAGHKQSDQDTYHMYSIVAYRFTLSRWMCSL